MFQSPFGDYFVGNCLCLLIAVPKSRCFSPLSGIISSETSPPYGDTTHGPRFQSPFGDYFVGNQSSITWYDQASQVSVPFRGLFRRKPRDNITFWRSIGFSPLSGIISSETFNSTNNINCIMDVSVPFRGLFRRKPGCILNCLNQFTSVSVPFRGLFRRKLELEDGVKAFDG